MMQSLTRFVFTMESRPIHTIRPSVRFLAPHANLKSTCITFNQINNTTNLISERARYPDPTLIQAQQTLIIHFTSYE